MARSSAGGAEWHAYAIANGRAQLRPVKVGRSSNTETEVQAGLMEGDEVILYPGDRITDRLRVKQVKM